MPPSSHMPATVPVPPPQPVPPPRDPTPPITWAVPKYPPVPPPPASAETSFPLVRPQRPVPPPPVDGIEPTYDEPTPTDFDEQWDYEETERVHPPLTTQPPQLPANDDWASPETSPSPSRRRLPVAALIAGVGVLVVALIIWLVVLPMVKGTPGVFNRPTSSVPGAVNAPRVLDSAPRIPDIVTKPSGWSSPVQLSGIDDWTYAEAIDTGVDNIILVQADDTLQAVDLDTLTVLWENTLFLLTLVTLDNGIAIVEADDYQLAFVELRTGVTTPIGILPNDDTIEYIDGQLVITSNWEPGTPVHLCARSFTNLGTCAWQADANDDEAARVFGDGQWVNTADGVRDLLTGEHATFGADDSWVPIDNGNAGVFYTGSSDDIVRFEYPADGSETTITPWDPITDKAKWPTVKLSGWVDPQSFNSSVILVQDESSRELSISAYSRQTGQKLWWKSPKLLVGRPVYTSFNNLIYLSIETQDSKQPDPNRRGSAIIDAQTGRMSVNQTNYRAIEAGQRVVYLVNTDNLDANFWQLYAGDSQSSNLAKLWSIKSPAAISGYLISFSAIANHVIGIAQETKQLWVLQP